MRVLALYTDGDDDVVNAQLLFYASAARASIPRILCRRRHYRPDHPSAGVDRSRCGDGILVAVTSAELDAFVTVYRAACEEALRACAAHRREGRIAGSARRTRSARRIPVRCLISLNSPRRRPPRSPRRKRTFQLLADGLNLVDAVKDIGKALHDQAKLALDHGDAVPGYALSAGRAVRQWKDEQAAVSALIALGLFRDDVVAETLRSPRQVELRARTRGVRISTEFIVSTRFGTSLVRAENARAPTPGRSDTVQFFSEASESVSRRDANHD